MAWDASLPAGSDMLRGSDDYIRANWTALETGTVPYDALKLQTQGSAPTAAADHGFLYSKDVSSKAELHYIDEDSNAIQMTSAGVIGGASTNITGATITGTTVNGTTFDTNVAAAGVTLTGTTLAADGTDNNIDITITPKGTGSVVMSKVDINGGAVDGSTVGAASASTGAFTTLTASTSLTAAGLAYPTSDGSANQYLKTDGAGTLSFGTVSAGMSYVSSTTVSSPTASVAFTGLNEANASYLFVLENVKPATDGVALRVQLSTDNGSTYVSSSSYSSAGFGRIASADNNAVSNNGTTYMQLTGSSYTVGNSTNETVAGHCLLVKPQNTNENKMVLSHMTYMNGSTILVNLPAGSSLTTSSAVDAMKFYFSSGNISSGTFTLYKLSGS